MSDAKPRRAGREASRSEIAASEAVPAGTVPMITPEPVADDVAITAAVSSPAELRASVIDEAVAREAADSVAPAKAMAGDAWTAFAAMQAVFARGFEEIAAEMSGLAQSSLAAAGDAATAVLQARTFAEAVEINAGLVRRRADAMVESAARLSEIGVKAMTEASRPVLAQLAATWGGAAIA
jgi:hypothetical protein